MRIAGAFLRQNSKNGKEEAENGKYAENSKQEQQQSAGATYFLPTTSFGLSLGDSSFGRVDRLRQGAQSAMNHLIYGKWRKLNGRMPRLDCRPHSSGSGCENRQVWLLGRAYAICQEEMICAMEADGDHEDGTGENEDKCRLKIDDEFLEEFRTFIWLSYREHFPPLQWPLTPNSGLPPQIPKSTTTDCGWGCMLRAAQMMLARALVQLRLGRDFRLSSSSTPSTHRQVYASIIRLFEDCPHSPLGLHALMEMANRREWDGPTIGRWYSPSQAAFLLRDALMVGIEDDKRKLSDQLRLAVCPDNCIVLADLRQRSRQFTVPLLIVIPLRLGTETINKIYMDHIQCLFTLNNFIGIIGGRPKYAAYLVGCFDKVLFSLDPHVVQSYRPLDEIIQNEDGKGENEEEQKKWSSFRCEYPTTIQMEEMDPSIALGFLISDGKELDKWILAMANNGLAELHTRNGQQTKTIPNPNGAPALFTILEEREKSYVKEEAQSVVVPIPKKGRRKSQRSQKSSNCSADADFEVL